MAIDTSILPTPDDLAGWKAVERALNKRIAGRIQALDLVNSSSIKQYFGGKNGRYLLEKYDNLSVMHAFIEWLVNDYRPPLLNANKKKARNRSQRKTTRRGKTLAEKLLAEGLPLAETTLLEASSQAHPGILRITDVEIGVSLTVEDILLGGERQIHDILLSGCIRPGHYLTGRVFPAGSFHFFSPMGPPLSGPLAVQAAEYLTSLGVEFTHEGLLHDAGKFGWLWDWYDDQVTGIAMPQLRNTDGEDLIWQTASFSVSEEGAVRRALNARNDIDYDDYTDEYLWHGRHGEHSGSFGDTAVWGHIRFFFGELLLEVNSAERLIAARGWLEEVPGVKYLGVRSEDLNDPAREVPLDDRMSSSQAVEMTPELAAQLQESFRQYYMTWLDTPLLALDGKTPRQTCKTKAGRQTVVMMIRTIPEPVGNGGIAMEVPRQQMLRELGLDSG